jgi:branched-chain amino acid transport system substrate-binding protein
VQAAAWLVSGALALGASWSAAAQSDTKEPLKLGFLASLTGPGAQSGAASLIGVKIALSEINAAGGIAGRPVVLVVADDHGDPTTGTLEARRLIYQEKIAAMLGPLFSAVTAAIVPILNQEKIVDISQVSSSMFTRDFAPYNFSMYYPMVNVGIAMANMLATELKAKSVAIITHNGVEAKDTIATLKKELDARHIKITEIQEYTNTDTDMTPQLLTLRRTEPDVLLVFSVLAENHANILRNLKEIGWTVPVFGSGAFATLTGPALQIAGPDAYDHAVSLMNKGLTYCSTDAPGSSEYAQFRDKLKKFDPEAAAHLSPENAAYFYGAPYVLKAAIEGSGGKTDGPTLAQWIEQKGKTMKLLNGDVEVSGDYHFMLGPDALTLVEHPERTREDGLKKRFNC